MLNGSSGNWLVIGGILLALLVVTIVGKQLGRADARDRAASVSGLQITDQVEGTGAEATRGDRVSVHYAGTLYPSGRPFDSSLERGEPFEFTLGAGRVIQGWEQGVQGMKVGGKRTLIIPPQLAYGERGAPPVIPPHATLQFEIELLDVK